MKPFQKREDPIVLMKRRLLIVALLIIVGVLGRGVYGVAMKERESRLLRQDVESELADMRAREAEIRTNIADLASERGIERALRSEHELAKEGESVIVIVEPEEQTSIIQAASPSSAWWEFWR